LTPGSSPSSPATLRPTWQTTSPSLVNNPVWAKNLARFMDDLPKDPLTMFFSKVHINLASNKYSEDLVKALSEIDEFKSASHRAHKYTRDAAKATDETGKSKPTF